MVDKSLNNNTVSTFKGAFIDRVVEKNYLAYDMDKTKRFLMPLLLFFAVLYLLFIIPDYINLGRSMRFYAVLLNRIFVVVLIMILYLKLSRAQSYDFYYQWIAIYEILIFASFLFTLLAYENPNILIQTYGMMLIIISLFLVPSRWLTTFLISLMFILAFHNISGVLNDTIDLSERYASFVFLLAVLVISGMASLRMNYYKRVQYYQEQKLMTMSITDPLTGCYNRLVLNKAVDTLYSLSNAHDAAIILFDLDNFKVVNDQYGHLNGDNVLIELVRLFMPLMNDKTSLIRWGGEEFLVFLKDRSLQEAVMLAKQLKETLAKHTFEMGITITCSFGVASSKECKTIDELLNKVDARLYHAKALGKNKIVYALHEKNL